VPGLQRFARGVAGPVPNLVDALPGIAQPALVLVGELDPNFQRASHVMAAKLPHVERVELAGAGHVLNLDDPKGFVREVERFVRSLGARL
jgi:pimeloyl-ACP methyl ester carboxylesterase